MSGFSQGRVFSDRVWINVAGDTSQRATGLTVAVAPAAYTPGSDPGDGGRQVSIVANGANTSGVVLASGRNNSQSWMWDLVGYAVGGSGNQSLDVNNNAGGYHTVATFDGVTNGVYAKGIFRSGPGTPISITHNYFSTNLASLNVVEICNRNAAGYTGLQINSSADVEQGALGFGNASTEATFRTNFWEGSGTATLSLVTASNTGRTAEFSNTGFAVYADSGSINTAYGTQVFSVDRATGDVTHGGVNKLKSFTVGTVPSASTKGAGAEIYVSNETGGAVPAFSDGTNWRRVTDRAVVS